MIFKHFDKKSSWRLVVNHDASSASKGRAYSHKGVMVLLMPDYINYDPRIHTISGKEVKESCFGGVGHILSAHEPNAKIISYSIRRMLRPLRRLLVWRPRLWSVYGWQCFYCQRQNHRYRSWQGSALSTSACIHGLQGLLFVDNGICFAATGQESEDIHPGTSRSRTFRTSTVGDSCTHAVYVG